MVNGKIRQGSVSTSSTGRCRTGREKSMTTYVLQYASVPPFAFECDWMLGTHDRRLLAGFEQGYDWQCVYSLRASQLRRTQRRL